MPPRCHVVHESLMFIVAIGWTPQIDHVWLVFATSYQYKLESSHFSPVPSEATMKLFGTTLDSLDAQACHSSHFLVQEPGEKPAADGAP